MKKGKKQIKGNLHYMKNNLFAIAMLWSASKKRVIHIVIKQLTDYFEWIFYQIFFLRFIINSIDQGYSFQEFLQLLAACFGVFTVLALYNSYFRYSIEAKTDVIIYQEIYSRLYKKARNVELRCYEDPDFYSKYTMAMDGAPNRIIQAANTFFGIVFGIVASIVAFGTIISIDIYASIFVIFPLVGNFGFGKLMNKIYYGRYVDNIKNERIVQYINRIMYLSDYAKEIRYSNIHDLMMKKFNKSVDDMTRVMDQYGNKGALYMWLKNVLTFPVVFEGVMLYTAYKAIVLGSISLSDLAIIFATMSTTSWILIGLFNNITDSLKNGLAVDYVKAFLHYKESISEDQDGVIPEKTIESIEFRNVSFYYKEEEPLIENLSFKISSNECVALVGYNGAGKSTLIKLLLRLYDPVAGEILVNGINIKEYNLKFYRELFGVSFQDYCIFAMSLKDNILMGRDNEGKEDNIDDIIREAGLADKINTFANGVNTNLTKEFDLDGEVMSGGEYQKVIIARTFAKKAAINIFDEPSSALDPISEYNLYSSIIKNRGKSIMIFISHRLSSVKDADIVYLLQQGNLIEKGSHEELMKKNGTYANIYMTQAKNYHAKEKL